MANVIIQMYHNNPPTRIISETGGHQDVWCYVAWNNVVEEAAEIAGGEEGVARAYDQLVLQANPWKLFPLPEGPMPDMAVFWLSGSERQMMQLVDRWARDIRDELPNVGGDDSHFDYFPDYVNGFRQLCVAIGTAESCVAYNETFDAVQNSVAYRDDPETEDLFAGRIMLPACTAGAACGEPDCPVCS